MRRLYIGLACLAVVAAVVIIGVILAYRQAQVDEYGSVVDMQGKSNVSVVLTAQGFQPREIRITQGTTVTFSTTRNEPFWPASDPHPTHTDYPQFDPKVPIDSKASWSFVFARVGSWGYHDHVRSYFTGTIYVVPQS
jgi:hypothetical protein